MKCFVTVAVIVSSFAVAASDKAPAKLPNYVKPCGAKDSTCLKNLLKRLGPQLIQGISEFNLPPIDPWNVPYFNQSVARSPHLSYFATVTDMKYEGLSNFNVSKFDVDLDRMKFDLKLWFPQVILTTNKVVSGVAFGISVNGSGITKATLSNLTVAFSLSAERNFIEGKLHLKWKDDVVSVSFDQAAFDVDDSFIDRVNYKKIMDTGNQRYPQVLYPEIQKSIKTTFAQLVLQCVNFVHETYPVDVLYLVVNNGF